MELELAARSPSSPVPRAASAARSRRTVAEGARVVLAARSQDELEAVAASLPNDSLVHTADLREPEAPAALVAAALARFGRIDALVNNAGATVRGDFLELSDAQWQDGFALKVLRRDALHARRMATAAGERRRGGSTSSASAAAPAAPNSPSAARSTPRCST
jgi:NADP-dependent 3-hydroxy acid dehydrogenase YdfG